MGSPHFILCSDKYQTSSHLLGGKASNLLWLKKQGVVVPDFFVLTTEAFDYYTKHKTLPEDSLKALQHFLQQYPTHQFAVRSSVTGEDGISHSFAGLFDTFLNCHDHEIISKIQDAYQSIHGPRVQEYINNKNITQTLSMALVIQVMTKSFKSGVVFSRSPIAPTSLMVIDAGLGLGEGVVSGHVDVQTIRLTRLLEVTSSYGPQILSEEEIRQIATTCLKLEKNYQTPCDIEWSIDEEKQLTILQIRPITQNFSPIKTLADTNLTESYPGVISPFTGLFVRKSYENVFTESAVALGASESRLKELKIHYAQLIAEIDNHLYYDLEHYYAILRALPGGEKNIDHWHRMIGGKLDFAYIPSHGTPLTKFETFKSICAILKYIIFHRSIFGRLLKHFSLKRDDVSNKIDSLKTGKDAMNYLSTLMETKFNFGLTVVNDALIMIGLGFLKKKLSHLSESDLIELLKTKEEVTSVKPLHAIEVLSKYISDASLQRLSAYNPDNWSCPYENFFQDEIKHGEEKTVIAIKNFLDKFGDRSFEELKLESLTFKQDPHLLAQTIIWLKKQDSSTTQTNKSQITSRPELDYLTRMILSKTQQTIEMRETTRMWRGKFYNLMRETLIKGAALLQEEHSSWKEFELKDFFSLTHLEWQRFAMGEIRREDAQRLMHERQGWKKASRRFPEFLVWALNESLPAVSQTTEVGELKGIGVSMGTIKGKCLVIEKPEEAFNIEDINNYILVTKNTDPAWVFIMSKSRGLISEKGSLLSHTAIIGRELNIPTIVGVAGATQMLKTNDMIEMNAEDGVIKIL